jgi:hypothetical protein
MSKSISLPDEVFQKLQQGAANHGMTVEKMLATFSDIVTNRERCNRIEILFDKLRSANLSQADRAELNHLVDLDFEYAIARADRLIASKQSRTKKSP